MSVRIYPCHRIVQLLYDTVVNSTISSKLTLVQNLSLFLFHIFIFNVCERVYFDFCLFSCILLFIAHISHIAHKIHKIKNETKPQQKLIIYLDAKRVLFFRFLCSEIGSCFVSRSTSIRRCITEITEIVKFEFCLE